MWRFKPFMQKDQAGLEGRSMDVGNLKIQIQKAIAEGGFSCVYLARDTVHVSKQYALKHMICNDEESLDLVMKEISVMKALRGHPNIVTLCAHTILDMGRTKEAYLVMEFCEKSLVSVLESRGSGYFDEKQVLIIFRDVCNAVFAMHCQSPPIAHRDLKAENLLLGPDGSWKLCDFGSTSTNHKRFEKPEEMGIEEDNIRKHTTPAYRSPEMWDLYRRDIINEKVDIWALGCLLFRVCYFKSAFDGESKLQILNGNYRIPELPKYSLSVTDLIRDMLQASPDDRPDITQVWFRVNVQLPEGLQKSLPDRPPEMHSTDIQGNSRHSSKSTMPRRSPPPPPPSGEPSRDPFQHSVPSKAVNGSGQLGAFWSTQHVHNTPTEDKNEAKFDEEPSRHDRILPENRRHSTNSVFRKEDKTQTQTPQKNLHQPVKDFDISFFQKASPGSSETSKDEAFNSFVAEFDAKKLSPELSNNKKSSTEQALEAQVESLKDQLKEVNSEKAEITSKFEKLSAICRAQRLEIQELKQAVASKTPSPNKDALKHQASPGTRSPAPAPQTDKNEENAREVHEKTPESKTWQAFAEESKPHQTPSESIGSKSVRTRNGRQASQPASGFDSDSWGFGTESFSALPSGGSQAARPLASRNDSPSTAVGNKPGSQPAGWAGF